jgi:hypothetical protein
MKRYTRNYKCKTVILDVDERIKPDDEWRSIFYDLYTLGDMARHIVHNLVTFGKDSFVEGVGDEGEYDPIHKTGGFKVLYMGEGGRQL